MIICERRQLKNKRKSNVVRFMRITFAAMSEIEAYAEREETAKMALLAKILQIPDIAVAHDFIMLRLVTGESIADADVDTDLASPAESVAHGRRKIHARAIGKIRTNPQIAKRCELAQLHVDATLNEKEGQTHS